jgi:RND family efflux transporter MFP subunit
MQVRIRYTLIALACVALVVSVIFGFHADTPAAVAASSDTVPRAAVTTVRRGAISSSVSVAGEFLPFQEVELHAKVAGYIRKINVDIGDHVRAGQVVASLEVPELDAQVVGADAGVRHSKDEITRAQHEVKRAEATRAALHSTYVRLQEAAAARPGLIAQQELDDAQAKDRSAEAQVDAAKAALSGSQQQMDVAKATHTQVSALQDYSRIVAPFDGVVTWRYADTGSLIQAGTSNNSSMPVVKLAQVATLRLRVPVPESLANSIHVGAPAEVRVQATGETFTGKIARLTDSFDRATRTMQVEIDVANPKNRLAPGMYADVRLQTEGRTDALSVPVQAVQQSSDKSTVLVLDAHNRVEKREISTGIEDPNFVQVLGGLREGERVIVGNLGSYQPGELVNPSPSKLVTASVTANSGGER